METEKCISCNCDTQVPVDLHIDNRDFYVEGAGQLCEKCWLEIYSGTNVPRVGEKHPQCF